jgi:hypothetical protein
MLIEVDNNVVAAHGMQQTNVFQIASSAHAFRILSSGLYSDKIGAVLREIGCNAMDAHIAAGKPDEPFEVHLPSRLINKFYIRDFGLGLSHDDILSLYTTYFSSSKSRSNDFTGAFGLGSKSPFSYTDNFTVTSVHNGKRNTYMAYVGTDGAPTISLVSEEEVGDSVPTGLTVSMAVKPDDIAEFIRKAQQIYQYFRVPPKILNGSAIRPMAYVSSHDTWAVPAVYNDAVYAVMGNVRYDIPLDECGDHRAFLAEVCPELRFAIGELDVAANREQLEYTPKTRKALEQRFNEVFVEFSKEIAEAILAKPRDTQTALRDMYEWFNSDRRIRTFAIRALTVHKADPNVIALIRQVIGHDFEIAVPSGFKGAITVYERGWRGNVVTQCFDYRDGDPLSVVPTRVRRRVLPKPGLTDMAVIIPDDRKYLRDRLKNIFKGGQPYDCLLYVSDDVAVAEQFAQDCMGLPTIKWSEMQFASDWVPPKDRPKKPRVKRARELFSPYYTVANGTSGYNDNPNTDILKFDPTDRAYIPVYYAWGARKHRVLNFSLDSVKRLVMAWAKLQPYIPDSPKSIALVNQGDIRRWKLEKDGWFNFPDWLLNKLKDPQMIASVNTQGVLDPQPVNDAGATTEVGSPLLFLSSHARSNTQLWHEIRKSLPGSPLVRQAASIAQAVSGRPTKIPAEIYNCVRSELFAWQVDEIDEKPPVDKSTDLYPSFAASLSHTFPNELVKKDQALAAKLVAELIKVDEQHLSSNIQIAA